VYTPHKVRGEDYIDGIEIRPCAMYAVNFEDPKRNMRFLEAAPERELLYAFMGAHQRSYLSDIRLRIFSMDKLENTVVANTGDWHFNNIVYSDSQKRGGGIRCALRVPVPTAFGCGNPSQRERSLWSWLTLWNYPPTPYGKTQSCSSQRPSSGTSRRCWTSTSPRRLQCAKIALDYMSTSGAVTQPDYTRVLPPKTFPIGMSRRRPTTIDVSRMIHP